MYLGNLYQFIINPYPELTHRWATVRFFAISDLESSPIVNVVCLQQVWPRTCCRHNQSSGPDGWNMVPSTAIMLNAFSANQSSTAVACSADIKPTCLEAHHSTCCSDPVRSSFLAGACGIVATGEQAIAHASANVLADSTLKGIDAILRRITLNSFWGDLGWGPKKNYQPWDPNNPWKNEGFKP